MAVRVCVSFHKRILVSVVNEREKQMPYSEEGPKGDHSCIPVVTHFLAICIVAL